MLLNSFYVNFDEISNIFNYFLNQSTYKKGKDFTLQILLVLFLWISIPALVNLVKEFRNKDIEKKRKKVNSYLWYYSITILIIKVLECLVTFLNFRFLCEIVLENDIKNKA